MKNNLPPLYYAIIGQFKDDAEHCAADIVAALESDYAGYKLLTNKDVEEALATAKENGILDETRADLDDNGQLRVFYRMSVFGGVMVNQYSNPEENISRPGRMPSDSVHEKVPPRANPRRDFCFESMEALPSLSHSMRLGRSLLNRDGLAVHHLPRREEDLRIPRHVARNGIGNIHDALFIIVTLQHDRMVSAPQAVAVARCTTKPHSARRGIRPIRYSIPQSAGHMTGGSSRREWS